MEALIREHYQKSQPDFGALHDEFIRLNRFHKTSLRHKVQFDYAPNDLAAVCERKTFTFRLPKTVYMLDEWANKLHNCMFGYAKNIHLRKTIIYGVFAEDELKYAVEISDLRIVQALGKFNRSIGDEAMSEISEWFRQVYVKSKMNVLN